MSRRLGITFSFTKQLISLFFFTIFSLFAEPPGYMTLGVRFSYANCPPSLLTYLTSHSFTFILQRHLGDMSRTYTRNFIDRICMDHLYQSIRMEIWRNCIFDRHDQPKLYLRWNWWCNSFSWRMWKRPNCRTICTHEHTGHWVCHFICFCRGYAILSYRYQCRYWNIYWVFQTVSLSGKLARLTIVAGFQFMRSGFRPHVLELPQRLLLLY